MSWRGNAGPTSLVLRAAWRMALRILPEAIGEKPSFAAQVALLLCRSAHFPIGQLRLHADWHGARGGAGDVRPFAPAPGERFPSSFPVQPTVPRPAWPPTPAKAPRAMSRAKS